MNHYINTSHTKEEMEAKALELHQSIANNDTEKVFNIEAELNNEFAKNAAKDNDMEDGKIAFDAMNFLSNIKRNYTTFTDKEAGKEQIKKLLKYFIENDPDYFIEFCEENKDDYAFRASLKEYLNIIKNMHDNTDATDLSLYAARLTSINIIENKHIQHHSAVMDELKKEFEEKIS